LLEVLKFTHVYALNMGTVHCHAEVHKEWVEIFKNSRKRVMDAERSGRPSTATEHKKQEETRAFILADRIVTTEEIALQLGVSVGRAFLTA